tara:strand:- start:15519 stop:15728 length:210 start_codon:yes stop_codon:yes gene_type:complete
MNDLVRNINILQEASDTNQLIGFSRNGMYQECIVTRITWDDYEDICSMKTVGNKHITVPVKQMEKIVVK